MKQHNRDGRQRLVVHQQRKTELHLWQPEVERVLAARERLAHSLDEQEMRRVVVVARDRDRELGQKGERGEERRHRHERAEHHVPPVLSDPADAHP